jgi:Tol biopolymer transport system component
MQFGPWMAPEPVVDLTLPDLDHYGPSLTNEPAVLFFSVGVGEEEDIWRATRESPSDPFSGAMAVPEVNTDTMDGTPYITPDGQTLWFASTRPGGLGGRDIWMAEGGVNGFAAAVNVSEINSDGLEHLPSMTADGLVVFFGSDRATPGSEDIFTAVREGTDMPFGEPTLVEELNSDDYDSSPAITPDGLTLYFTSTREAVDVTTDIFVATRASRGDPFGEPAVVEELNSLDSDEDPRLAPSRLEIFFASNRDTGEFQIWHAQRECLDP